jgi:DNA-binding phage protein
MGRLQEAKEKGRRESQVTPLTRKFRDTIKARIERDPAFRDELLREGMDCFLQGDVETGKAILRNFINATVGFQKLATATSISPKSLMRMFSETGNPRAENLFNVIRHLQSENGVRLSVSARSSRPSPRGRKTSAKECVPLVGNEAGL